MPNEKIKSEQYVAFGGINQKSSPYSSGPVPSILSNGSLEFLDIINFDFQIIGSLPQRWGSTMYVGQTFSGPIATLFEYSKLDGTSYLMIGATGQLWQGATTGQSQGVSFGNIGVTFSYAAYFGSINSNVVGHTRIINSSIELYYQDNGAQLLNYLGAGTSMFLDSQAMAGNKLSTIVFQDYMFAADGNVFFKFDGLTTSPVGLPPATWLGSAGASIIPGTSALALNVTMVLGVWASYVNRRGFEGPIWPISDINLTSYVGVTTGSALISYNINTPLQYDIASVNLYTYAGPSLSIIAAFKGASTYWNLPYRFFSNTPASGSSFTVVSLQSNGPVDPYANAGNFPPNPLYAPLGLTLQAFTTAAQAITGAISEIDMVNYFPQYLEIYQNRLFLAGFSSSPSTVWFSDIGEPEGYQPNWNFEVRTNDADVVTCIKAYLTRLYIFKNNSFHILFGDGGTIDNTNINFSLQEVSTIYGCLNNRCAVIFQDQLAFLDRKGVVIYNGATPSMLSDKIQPIFDTMNYAVAVNTACMVHDKLRNQILIAIPLDASTQNNVTLVYDYLVNAWTKQDGYNPTVFAIVQGRNNTKNAFYGTSNGMVNWFGSSMITDNGAGFTTYIKTRFLHDLGESYQKQFRRLYLNIDAPSSTLTFQCNFFQDFGSSIVKSVTINCSQFQTRIDYGISAKSLAFELSSFQSNQKLTLHGFTIESRLQRKV